MLKVLIVEDDLMIADITEDFLVASGYEVCGIARTVDKAVALARLRPPDLAVIDLRLADGALARKSRCNCKNSKEPEFCSRAAMPRSLI